MRFHQRDEALVTQTAQHALRTLQRRIAARILRDDALGPECGRNAQSHQKAVGLADDVGLCEFLGDDGLDLLETGHPCLCPHSNGHCALTATYSRLVSVAELSKFCSDGERFTSVAPRADRPGG